MHKTYLVAAALLCAAPAAANAHYWRAPHCGPAVQEIGAVEVAPNVYVLDDLAPYPYIGPRVHRWHHWRRWHGWHHRRHWHLSYMPMRHYEWRERSHPRRHRLR